MLSGEKPDQLSFAIWVAESLTFEQGSAWKARALWLHWADFARSRQVEAGTPRTFSGALRRLGSKVSRGVDQRRPRSRFHHDVRLCMPKLPVEAPEGMDPETWRSIRRLVGEHNWKRYHEAVETRWPLEVRLARSMRRLAAK